MHTFFLSNLLIIWMDHYHHFASEIKQLVFNDNGFERTSLVRDNQNAAPWYKMQYLRATFYYAQNDFQMHIISRTLICSIYNYFPSLRSSTQINKNIVSLIFLGERVQLSLSSTSHLSDRIDAVNVLWISLIETTWPLKMYRNGSFGPKCVILRYRSNSILKQVITGTNFCVIRDQIWIQRSHQK